MRSLEWGFLATEFARLLPKHHDICNKIFSPKCCFEKMLENLFGNVGWKTGWKMVGKLRWKNVLENLLEKIVGNFFPGACLSLRNLYISRNSCSILRIWEVKTQKINMRKFFVKFVSII